MASKKKTFMGINPKNKGYCTPMSKPTCTPRRKALAKRLKPGGDLYKGKTMKKKQQGGPLKQLNDMQYARKGKAVGSILEGGRIMYKGGPTGGPQDIDLPEQQADTSNIFQKGLFRKARARNYAKNNPGTASSVRNYGKRRVVTTYNDDGFKGRSSRKNV